MTGNQLIGDALRLIGAQASGETTTGAEASDALRAVNRMLDAWNSERLSVFHIERNGGSTDATTFPLVPSQPTYTIGQDGSPDFNVVRPAKITHASIEYLGNLNTPIELPLDVVDEAVWRHLPVKSTQSNIPHVIWPDNNFPNRTLSLYTVPSEVHNLVLYMWVPLTSFANLTTPNTYPPGYEEALVYNLAVRLAPEFGRTTPVEVAAIAVESKAKLRAMNTPTPLLTTDPALPKRQGHYNFYTDEARHR